MTMRFTGVGGRGRVFMAVYASEGGHAASSHSVVQIDSKVCDYMFQKSKPPHFDLENAEAWIFPPTQPLVDGEQGMGLGVSWYIDANAAQGSFLLGLSVEDEDGLISDLGSSEGGQPWRLHVRIGGPVTGVVVKSFASPTASSWWRERDHDGCLSRDAAGPLVVGKNVPATGDHVETGSVDPAQVPSLVSTLSSRLTAFLGRKEYLAHSTQWSLSSVS